MMPIIILVITCLIFGTIYLVITKVSEYSLKIRLTISVLATGLMLLFILLQGSALNYLADNFQQIFKSAPYNSAEFKSFFFKYGDGDSLVNTYNSATGEYQYLDKRDSLIKTNLLLTKNEMLYLHHKAAELGFWDLPEKELGNDTALFKGIKPPRYYIEFKYDQKSKHVLFDAAYDGDAHLRDASMQMVNEIMHVLTEAERRQKK